MHDSNVTFRLDAELLRLLDEAADYHGMSRTAAILHALRDWYGTHRPPSSRFFPDPVAPPLRKEDATANHTT